jgi:hypothetical protein
MEHTTLIMEEDEHTHDHNPLVILLNGGWHIIASTSIVTSVSTGSKYSTCTKLGKVAYVLERDDD